MRNIKPDINIAACYEMSASSAKGGTPAVWLRCSLCIFRRMQLLGRFIPFFSMNRSANSAMGFDECIYVPYLPTEWYTVKKAFQKPSAEACKDALEILALWRVRCSAVSFTMRASEMLINAVLNDPVFLGDPKKQNYVGQESLRLIYGMALTRVLVILMPYSQSRGGEGQLEMWLCTQGLPPNIPPDWQRDSLLPVLTVPSLVCLVWGFGQWKNRNSWIGELDLHIDFAKPICYWWHPCSLVDRACCGCCQRVMIQADALVGSSYEAGHWQMFVNYVAEVAGNNMTIRDACDKYDIPLWVVEIRHAATHSTMPSITDLREAMQFCWEWMQSHYWEREIVPSTQDVTESGQHLQTGGRTGALSTAFWKLADDDVVWADLPLGLGPGQRLEDLDLLVHSKKLNEDQVMVENGDRQGAPSGSAETLEHSPAEESIDEKRLGLIQWLGGLFGK